MKSRQPPRIDPLSPSERSARMALVRGKNTKPELIVRKILHCLGYRYRLHLTTIPGRPDLVFPKRKKVIFVHGCFWHQHGCGHYKMPQSRTEFWNSKLAANKQRGELNIAPLKRVEFGLPNTLGMRTQRLEFSP
jgi:DNA mismatch endonuclease (patch repair protein)